MSLALIGFLIVGLAVGIGNMGSDNKGDRGEGCFMVVGIILTFIIGIFVWFMSLIG